MSCGSFLNPYSRCIKSNMQRNRQQERLRNLREQPEEDPSAQREQHKPDTLAVQPVILQMRHSEQEGCKENSAADIDDSRGMELPKTRMLRENGQNQPPESNLFKDREAQHEVDCIISACWIIAGGSGDDQIHKQYDKEQRKHPHYILWSVEGVTVAPEKTSSNHGSSPIINRIPFLRFRDNPEYPLEDSV